MPFPIRPANPPQLCPTGGNPKPRNFKTSGRDNYIGPDYRERRMAGSVIPVTGSVRDVRRFGVAVTNRGEWKR